MSPITIDSSENFVNPQVLDFSQLTSGASAKFRGQSDSKSLVEQQVITYTTKTDNRANGLTRASILFSIPHSNAEGKVDRSTQVKIELTSPNTGIMSERQEVIDMVPLLLAEPRFINALLGQTPVVD